MRSISGNSALLLADHASAESLLGVLDGFSLDWVVCHNHKETSSILQTVYPKIIVVDEYYLQKDSGELKKLLISDPALKFVPVIFRGNSEDEVLKGVYSEFPEFYFADKTGQDGLIREVEKRTGTSVRIKFWGVRGSTPSPNSAHMKYGGNTSCVQIESPDLNRLLILDCGTGIRNLGNHLMKSGEKTLSGNIFITHPHWDHIQGFPFFKPFYSSKNSFSVHMPGQYRGGAREILSGHLTKTFFPVTLDMLDAKMIYETQDEEMRDYDGYSIEYLAASHPTKTAIYKIHIAGQTIVYSPDNELTYSFSPLQLMKKFEAFIEGCDLLIHDAQYSERQYKQREGWGHSAREKVVEVAKKNGVKRLVLTHHDPDSDDDYLMEADESLSRYSSTAFSKICLAREGLEVRLPHPHHG